MLNLLANSISECCWNPSHPNNTLSRNRIHCFTIWASACYFNLSHFLYCNDFSLFIKHLYSFIQSKDLTNRVPLDGGFRPRSMDCTKDSSMMNINLRAVAVGRTLEDTGCMCTQLFEKKNRFTCS